jgi:hypothetical protein
MQPTASRLCPLYSTPMETSNCSLRNFRPSCSPLAAILAHPLLQGNSRIILCGLVLISESCRWCSTNCPSSKFISDHLISKIVFGAFLREKVKLSLRLVKNYAKNTYGEWMYRSVYSWPWHYLEVSRASSSGRINSGTEFYWTTRRGRFQISELLAPQRSPLEHGSLLNSRTNGTNQFPKTVRVERDYNGQSRCQKPSNKQKNTIQCNSILRNYCSKIFFSVHPQTEKSDGSAIKSGGLIQQKLASRQQTRQTGWPETKAEATN